MILMWDNGSAAKRCGNTSRPLTQPVRLQRTEGSVKPIHPPCVIDGCMTPWYARGLCRNHYKVHQYHGTIDQFSKAGSRLVGPNYTNAHRSLIRARGKAADQTCVDCGQPATDWSYVGGAPDERPSEWGPFSYLPEFYAPRCKPCHSRLDKMLQFCLRGHPYEGKNVGYKGKRRFCRACQRLLWRRMYWRKKGLPMPADLAAELQTRPLAAETAARLAADEQETA